MSKSASSWSLAIFQVTTGSSWNQTRPTRPLGTSPSSRHADLHTNHLTNIFPNFIGRTWRHNDISEIKPASQYEWDMDAQADNPVGALIFPGRSYPARGSRMPTSIQPAGRTPPRAATLRWIVACRRTCAAIPAPGVPTWAPALHIHPSPPRLTVLPCQYPEQPGPLVSQTPPTPPPPLPGRLPPGRLPPPQAPGQAPTAARRMQVSRLIRGGLQQTLGSTASG